MAKPKKVLVYRHAAVTRATHWINVLALTFLLMSGLNIFGAHPALYWGQKAVFAQPWVLIGAEPKAGGMQLKNECTIEIEGEEKPACIAETITLIYDR